MNIFSLSVKIKRNLTKFKKYNFSESTKIFQLLYELKKNSAKLKLNEYVSVRVLSTVDELHDDHHCEVSRIQGVLKPQL